MRVAIPFPSFPAVNISICQPRGVGVEPKFHNFGRGCDSRTGLYTDSLKLTFKNMETKKLFEELKKLNIGAVISHEDESAVFTNVEITEFKIDKDKTGFVIIPRD